MDEQLKAKLIQYLDRLEGATQQVGEVAATEIPATIREYLLWLLIERCAYALAFAVPMIVALVVRNRWRTWIERYKDEDEVVLIHAARFVLWVGAICSITLGSGYWALHAVKVAVAPRVVLIERVSELVGARK